MSSLLSGFADTLNSTLLLPEQRRAQSAQDTDFCKPCVIFFELFVPKSLSSSGSTYLFPLSVPPQAISIMEPHNNDITVTQRGGVYVEQSGCVMRKIRIRGTTGFWPAPFSAPSPQGSVAIKDQSFSRQLPRSTGDNLSGMRQLQHLQDWLRTVGDLARNPETTGQVRLVYHDVTQNEHHVVLLDSFSLEQSSQSPHTATYDVALTSVDKASALVFAAVPRDTSLLGALKDAYSATQNFLTRANQSVVALSALQGDLSRTVHGVGATLGQVGTVIGAVADFVAGTTSLVKAPFQIISSISLACENLCRVAFNAEVLGASIVSWPRDASVRFRQIQTSCEQLALSSAPFAQGPSPRSGLASSSTADASPATSFAALRQQGSSSSLQAGSFNAGTDAVPAPPPGALRYTVQSGDSLSSLAARYLGSATLWSQIAAANGFTPPVVADAPAQPRYGDATFYGSVLRVGDSIAIPSTSQPANIDPNVPVVGATPDAPPDEKALGVDLLLRTDARGQLDLSLGQMDGLPDLAIVAGADNVRQAARTRLGIERGTALTTPELGLQRLVGSGQAEADLQQVQLRVTQALQDDPRVQSIEDLRVVPRDDAVGLEMTLRLVDGAGQENLALAL